MAQVINLNIKGLYTYPSEISGAPQGALTVADDITISRNNIAEVRRGYNNDLPLPSPSERAKSLFFYKDKLFGWTGSLLYISNGGYTSVGSLVAPSTALTIRTAQLAKNLYVTSNQGLMKLDDTSGMLYKAGMPKGTMLERSLSPLVTPGTAVPTLNYVAYRYIICRTDKNQLPVYGGVSQRFIFNNTTGAAVNVPLRVWLPDGLDNTYFVQVYKTAVGTTVPNDEMQLCYEYPLTTTDAVTNKYFEFLDITETDLLGDTLYTSASQQGIVNSNLQPPLAADITTYKGFLFFANTASKHRYYFTLISADSALGIQNNDTITVGGQTYIGKIAPNPSNVLEFKIVTTGSASQLIDGTARALVKAINLNPSSLQYASIAANKDSDLPGKILIEERGLGGAAFTVTASKQDYWNPQLQSTTNDRQTSKNDQFLNGLMWSKNGIFESVPLPNILFVGAADDPIKRIIGLRDALFIFKAKGGIYRLTGENEASFAVTLLDSNAKILAPESISVTNNLIYGLFTAGIGEVSDTGVTYISTPFKDKLLDLMAKIPAQIAAQSFAVNYETEGFYLLALPSNGTDGYCSQVYVYNVYNATFFRWLLPVGCGAISNDDKIYFGAGNSNSIKVERKSFNHTDQADLISFTNTVTAQNGAVIHLSGGLSEMAIGDEIVQGDIKTTIQAIDLIAGTVTIDYADFAFALSAFEHFKAIPAKIEWISEVGGNPAGTKLFSDGNLMLKRAFKGVLKIFISTDINPSESVVTLTGEGFGDFGAFAFGSVAFGGLEGRQPERFGIPHKVARGNAMYIRIETSEVFQDMLLNGLTLTFNPTSTRTTKTTK